MAVSNASEPSYHARTWPSRLRRFAAWLVVLLVVLALLGWFVGKPYAERLVREKLITLVAQQLNARLDLGQMRYHFPYAVEAREAALYSTTPGEPSIKLASFKRLDVRLAQSPFRKGPVIIERVDVQSPTMYVVEDKQHGFIGLEHLFRIPADKEMDSQPPPKLSDVLRLKHVALADARIEYDDRTISKSVPFVWDKLNLALDGQQLSASAYHFSGGAGNGDTARVDANGSIDVDTLILTLNSLSLTAKLTPGQRVSPLPAGAQRVLNTLGVAGSGRATITGVVPFLHARDIDVRGDFVIDDAQGRLSPEGRPLNDLDVAGKLRFHGREITVNVDVFSCRRAALGVSILPVTVTYILKTDRWTVSTVHAAVAYFPPPATSGILNQRATVTLVADLTELKARDQLRANLLGTKISFPDTAGELAVEGAVRYDDDGITIEAARLTGLGGTTTVAGVINENVSAVAGEITLAGIDLDKLNQLASPGTTRSLLGKLDGNVKAAVTDSLDAVRGDGRFRVTGGKFAKVPILGGIAEALKIGQNAFVAHEATGRFTLATDRLTFQRFAVSTDMLSAVGNGDVHYDGQLGLSVYADGHWDNRRKPGQLYIPVLSDIGQGLAKTGQYVFGSVTRQFTHFTVKGTVDQPKIMVSPAPVLTEGLAKAFHEK